MFGFCGRSQCLGLLVWRDSGSREKLDREREYYGKSVRIFLMGYLKALFSRKRICMFEQTELVISLITF